MQYGGITSRMKTVNILGSEYKIIRRKFDEEPDFEKKNCDGYCDYYNKEIVYCNMLTHPNTKDEGAAYCRGCECYTLRHEILHALFSESGLAESSAQFTSGWAVNEEMVDWFAIQAPKALKIFLELGLLSDEGIRHHFYDGCEYDEPKEEKSDGKCN